MSRHYTYIIFLQQKMYVTLGTTWQLNIITAAVEYAHIFIENVTAGKRTCIGCSIRNANIYHKSYE